VSRLPVLPWLALAAAVLAGCGSPPQPLPTAPPQATGSFGSASAAPPSAIVTTPPTFLPPQTVAPLPTLPVTPATTSPSPTPKGAPKCANGPTPAQVLAAVKGQPGIPDATLDVHAGPYCSGTWQFTELELAGKSPDEIEPLLVVTTGKPSALVLIEAGTDVCSRQVQNYAPAGIRVRACGF
jgi:hypothetical protein